MPELSLTLFGAPRIELGGKPVQVERQKSLALLAYLAVTQQPHRRDLLATLLWPEASQSHARASLRRVLSALQVKLRHPWLATTTSTLALPAQANLWVDVLEFRQGLTAARTASPIQGEVGTDDLELMSQAAALYTGEFLSGFSLPDCPDFEDWQRLEAENLRRDLAMLLDRLSAGYAHMGNPAAAIRHARRWVQLDALHEPAQVRLMQLYAQAGHLDALRHQYHQFAQLLTAEFGDSPMPATTDLYQTLLQRHATAPPAPSVVAPSTNVLASASGLRSPRFLSASGAPPTAESPLCVAREDFLSQLYSYLDGALVGVGQVVFITGEAGTGKTTLMREFLRRSLDAHPELVAAYGACDAYTGIGSAYFPFRTVLEMLTGAVEEQWAAGILPHTHALRLWQMAPPTAANLVMHGRELIDTFVDGNALAARAKIWGQADPAWSGLADAPALRQRNERTIADQPHLFEQYLAVVRRLTARNPLLVVLDDLHWADTSSIGLLFFLGKQLRYERILILCAYRPEEVGFGWAGRPHPLVELREELRRTHGDAEISLDRGGVEEGHQFVDALLDSVPNRLDEGFRQKLYDQSRGHPLFTVELLHDMQENKQLIQDAEGRWIEGEPLTWESLPAKVEGVIARRIGRLDRDLLEILSVAAVEGEQFTAEVVAAVCGLEPQVLVRRLSNDLAKHHRLVQAQGVRQVNGLRLALYRFCHNLIQYYLYHSLDPVEQIYLHERVAHALEALFRPYPDELAAHASQLAYHFEAARLADEAVTYWQHAGEQAVKVSANDEAVHYFSRALALLKTLPAGPARANRELVVHVSMGVPLSAVRGYSHHETASVYRRARRLSVATGNTQHLFPALYGLWRYHLVRGQLRAARLLVGQLRQLGEASQDRALQLEAARAVGITYYHLGAPADARIHLERGLALYDWHSDATHAYLYGHDPGVSCYSYLAPALWLLGYPDQALALAQTGLHLAKQLDHPFSLVHSWLNGAAQVHLMRREYAAAQALSQAAVNVSSKHRFPQWQGFGMVLWGASLAAQGQAEAGITKIRAGLETLQSIHMKAYQGFFLALLAESYVHAGQLIQAQATVVAGLAAAATSGECAWEAELHRLLGKILWGQAAPLDQVEACFQQALAVARSQQARALELRATISLCRLWRRTERSGEPQLRLAELYATFDEGADTVDLCAAMALLDQSDSL